MQEQLNRLNNETVSAANKENEQGRLDFETTVAIADSNKKLKSKLTSSGSKAGIKIRGQASRIVSSFKTQSIVCSLVRDFSGIHNDGKSTNILLLYILINLWIEFRRLGS